MQTSTITPIGHKPIVRSLKAADFDGEVVPPAEGTRIVNVYLTDAQAAVMLRVDGDKVLSETSWAPTTKERAINVARKQAFAEGLPQERSLFYVHDEAPADGIRHVYGDVDAGSDCLDLDALNRHLDSDKDSLIVFYDAARCAFQAFRVYGNDVEWWYKARPVTRGRAMLNANEWCEEYRLTMDQLHFYEVDRAGA